METPDEELDRGVPPAPEDPAPGSVPPASEDPPGGSVPPAPQTPPETSDHPPHEEEIGGAGAEDPGEMADEDRYRKGPGW